MSARASATVGLAAAVALGAAAWAALDPARGGFSVLLAALAVIVAGFAWVEGSPGLGKGRHARRDACRAGRSRARPLRSGAGRPARHRDRRCGRGRARAACRFRRRCSSRAGVEHVPRAGRSHAVADGRVGRMRARGWALSPLLRTRAAFALFVVRPRVRLRDADGLLGLVRVLPTHVRGAARATRGRLPVQRRARRREPRARARQPGRSYAGCSNGTPGGCERSSCGPDAHGRPVRCERDSRVALLAAPRARLHAGSARRSATRGPPRSGTCCRASRRTAASPSRVELEGGS